MSENPKKSLGETVANVGAKGVKIPVNLIIKPATYDPASGALGLLIGFQFTEKTKGGLWLDTAEMPTSMTELAAGIFNDLRDESSLADADSPGELTLAEAGKVFFRRLSAALMGKL